eukprot:767242-Hanusia_phi.AAC.3
MHTMDVGARSSLPKVASDIVDCSLRPVGSIQPADRRLTRLAGDEEARIGPVDLGVGTSQGSEAAA